VSDVLEVNGGVLRLGDKAAVRSEVEVEAAVSSEVGDMVAACSRAGIEDGRQQCVVVSRVTEEREHLAVSKNC
jgi:hypothetical protein